MTDFSLDGTGSNPGRTNTQGLKITEKCCLYNGKRYDFLVFSDKDEKPWVPSHSTYTYLFLWDEKEHTQLFEKSWGRSPGGVANLHTSQQSHHGLGGYSELIKNGAIAADSGAFVCCRPSLLLTYFKIYIVKKARLLSSHP